MTTPPFIRKIFTQLMTAYFRYLVMATVFIVAVAGYMLFLQPQFESVRKVGILGYQTEAAKLQDRQDYLDKVKKMIDAYHIVQGQQLTRAEDILPTEPKINDIFLTLQAIVRESKMELQSVSITRGSSLVNDASATAAGDVTKKKSDTSATKIATGTIQILDVNIALTGATDYASYKAVVRNFERSMRIFDVVNLSYKPAAAPSSKTTTPEQTEAAAKQTGFGFELKTYYYEAPSSTKG